MKRIVVIANHRISRIAHAMTRQHSRVLSMVAPRPVAPPDVWFPGEELEEVASTYPCDPTAVHPYQDQYRILNPNPVAITSNAIQLALENRSRAEMFIVNVSTVSILIAFGFVPTTTVYTMPLQACAIANDGTGGIIIDAEWQGAVWAILAANAPSNGSLLFTELPEK